MDTKIPNQRQYVIGNHGVDERIPVASPAIHGLVQEEPPPGVAAQSRHHRPPLLFLLFHFAYLVHRESNQCSQRVVPGEQERHGPRSAGLAARPALRGQGFHQEAVL